MNPGTSRFPPDHETHTQPGSKVALPVILGLPLNNLSLAFVGLGSNLGQPLRQCQRALAALSQHPSLTLVASSSWYRTQPVGRQHQPWFINAVAAFSTSLSPTGLLHLLWRLESHHGRNRLREGVHGPRTLDLDLLLYGQKSICNRTLRVPHPELPHRRFVLLPLAEIAADYVHPLLGKTIDLLLQETDDTSRVEVVRLPPWKTNRSFISHPPP